MTKSKIVVLDFGSQYAHLIAKKFRSLGYFTQIALPSAHLDTFQNAQGIVLSGGPASIYDTDASNIPPFNQQILDLDIPILGLCYGHYVINIAYGGQVQKAPVGEFGFALLNINTDIQSPIFQNIHPKHQQQVWMSHQDAVVVPGQGFQVIAQTPDCKYAALQNLEKKRFSLQFHCEVNDTLCGLQIFQNFAQFCNILPNWNNQLIIDQIIHDIQTHVPAHHHVLLFLSGGVDSTVTFALLNQALGTDRVLGLHINNGFMRKNESIQIQQLYQKYGFQNFIIHDASQSFLQAVQNITDPQKKRLAIGQHFITVKDSILQEYTHLQNHSWILAQGTLYPDIIESGGTLHSNVIKTHHNRVSAVQELIQKGLIIEPLRDLYKDEVRSIGKAIGLDDELILRHPFPGPGLAINLLCHDQQSWTQQDQQEYQSAVQEFNQLEDFHNLLSSHHFKKYVLPVRSVGVQGDFRTYKFPSIIQFFSDNNNNNQHGIYQFPTDRAIIETISSSIINNTKYINRLCLLLYQNTCIQFQDMKLQTRYCEQFYLDQLREVDDIVITELKNFGWYNQIFQHLTISLPFSSSPQKSSFVLRPVCSEDVMTARFAILPKELLDVIIEKVSKLDFVDALFYDVTNKPPATFGWE
ncbi:GMP synthase [Cryptosporidium canis]|nr:GMP synthase [Cryptosporidium canis]